MVAQTKDPTWSKTKEKQKNKISKKYQLNDTTRNPFGRYDVTSITSMLLLQSKENLTPTKLSSIHNTLQQSEITIKNIDLYIGKSPEKCHGPNKTELKYKRKLPFGNLYTDQLEIKYVTIEKIEPNHSFFLLNLFTILSNPKKTLNYKTYSLHRII